MIPEGWKPYKLGDFIDINPSVHLKKDEKFSFIEMKDLDSTRKYVTPSCKKKLAGGAKFCNGDTLFARITPCLENGKICQARNIENNCGFGSTEFIVLRGKKEISISDFVYYLSRSNYIRNAAIQNMTGTSGRQRVETSAFAEIDFIAPLNLTVQSRIASILSSLDDKIELNLRMNKTLEAIAQAIFKEWFVDFRFPGFDGELVDELPKGWRKGKLGDIINLRYGKALKTEERVLGKYPVVGSSGIVGFHNIPLVKSPGIVIGRKGTIGEVIWMDEDFYPIDTTFYIEDRINADGLFYHYYLLSLQDFNRIGSDSAVPGLNKNQALMNKVTIPDIIILNKFNRIINPLFTKKYLNFQENKILSEIRDILLPKLMTGKIRVA